MVEWNLKGFRLACAAIGSSLLLFGPTLAQADEVDCWPIIAPHPKPKPNVTPPAFSPVHVYRIRLDRPISRKSEVTWACEAPAPGIYETVTVIAAPPILPPPLKQVDHPTFVQISEQPLVVPTPPPPPVGGPTSFIVSHPLVAAVPEPQTWAMLILGFGLIGVALRRRRGARAWNLAPHA